METIETPFNVLSRDSRRSVFPVPRAKPRSALRRRLLLEKLARDGADAMLRLNFIGAQVRPGRRAGLARRVQTQSLASGAEGPAGCSPHAGRGVPLRGHRLQRGRGAAAFLGSPVACHWPRERTKRA